MIYAEDGEYYVVKLDEGTYYKGYGIGFHENRITTDIGEAQIYLREREITKDLYFQQFLFGKNIEYDHIKVRVTTNVEIITE